MTDEEKIEKHLKDMLEKFVIFVNDYKENYLDKESDPHLVGCILMNFSLNSFLNLIKQTASFNEYPIDILSKSLKSVLKDLLDEIQSYAVSSKVSKVLN